MRVCMHIGKHMYEEMCTCMHTYIDPIAICLTNSAM